MGFGKIYPTGFRASARIDIPRKGRKYELYAMLKPLLLGTPVKETLARKAPLLAISSNHEPHFMSRLHHAPQPLHHAAVISFFKSDSCTSHVFVGIGAGSPSAHQSALS